MARRIPGEWVPFDVNTARNKRIRQAGCMAELLFRRSVEYSKGAKLDGEVPKYDLPVVGIGITGELAEYAATLVRTGLWEDRDDHWYITGYAERNATQAEISADREAKRQGAIKTNHKRHADTPDPACPLCDAKEDHQ